MIFNTDKMIDVDNSTVEHAVNTQFDCLISDVGVNNQIIKTDPSDYMDRYLNQSVKQNNFTSLNTFQKHKANYNVKLSSDYMISMGKYQFLLMAPTSPAVKVNEETLTYLNQGQNYELKLSCNETPHLNELQIDQNYAYQNEDIKPFINLETKSIESGYILNNHSNGNTTLNQIVRDTNEHDLSDKLPHQENTANNQNLNLDLSDQNKNLVYLSVVRVCFWDRKLQEMEQDEIKEWEKEYPNMRMLEIDSNSSYGIIEVRTSDVYINAAEILWNGRTGANIFFRCNCTSTAFAPHKHGGEKGIHMRFQIDTYEIDLPDKKINFNNEMLNFNPNHNVATSTSSITSVLSPPNSTSSPNSIKFVKDDLEPYSSNRYMNTPTPKNNSKQWLEFNEIKHVSSSFCRIQLFRLKGAQRKLKTDRSKIERLNPPDLRKRYQPSSKITILNNCSYDWLYSLIPFVKEPNHHLSEINSEIENYPTSNSHFNTNVDYTNNSYSNSGFVPSQPYQNIVGGSSSIEYMNNINQNQYINHYSSMDISNQNESAFYLENSYLQIQNHGNLSNTMQNNDYGYNRMKRTSSFNSAGNFQNLKPNKIQKTAIASTVSSSQICNTTFNNMSSLASSSASSSSSTSSPASPVSPIINCHHSQPTLSNQQYTQLDYPNVSLSCPLPYDCTNKYVQEWLIQNRFFNLLSIFSNYTSNDVLRLSKEDMVTLCGGADGIRCFNLAHNIQIKPKLTIFVTFNEQSYYSAIFINESKSHFLLNKVLNAFSSFVKLIKIGEKKKEQNPESEIDDDEKKFKTNQDLATLHEKIISGNVEYELFLKIKGALVLTTDEVLNNFEDQSKFLIEFEISESKIDFNKTMHLKPYCMPNNTNNLTKTRMGLVKVMLIPLD